MLEQVFLRGVSVSGIPALGSDVDPTTLTGEAAIAYANTATTNSNVIADKAGGQTEDVTANSLAVAVWYAGVGTPNAITVNVYSWNQRIGLWTASAETLNVPVALGAVTLVPLPTSKTHGHGGVYAVLVNTSSPPNGTYTIGLGMDYRALSQVNLKAGSLSIGTVAQGTAAVASGAWTAKVTDGTNIAGVAAASTAVVAAQPSLAVGLHPSSPLPAGTNTLGKVNQGTGLGAALATAWPVNSVGLGPPGTIDLFGQVICAESNPQISIPFFQGAPSTWMTITSTNGGTTAAGTGAQASMGLFSSGTNVSGTLKALSNSVSYLPGCEVRCIFTAQFTTPTNAAEIEQVGICNLTDGLAIGYNGTTFGIWTYFNGTPTFIAQASWNKDTLTGAAGTLFTSAGAALTLNPNDLVLYRLRYGYLGVAAFYFEVFSPDNGWVTFHEINNSDVATHTSFTNPNLPFMVNITKTSADATNLVVGIGCVSAGITSDTSAAINGAGTLTSGTSVIQVPVSGCSSGLWTITGTWVANIIGQYSGDGINWTTDTGILNSAGSIVPNGIITANGSYRVNTGNYRFYQLIPSTYTSGTANVTYAFDIASQAQSIVAVQGCALGTTPAAQGTVEAVSANVNASSAKTYAGDVASYEDVANNVAWQSTSALATSKNAWSNTATSTAANGVAKNTTGRFRSVRATNGDSSAAFFILYNSTTAPGASPTAASIYEAVEVPAGTTVTLDYPEGLYLATGLSWGWYTTYALSTAYSGGKTLTSTRWF